MSTTSKALSRITITLAIALVLTPIPADPAGADGPVIIGYSDAPPNDTYPAENVAQSFRPPVDGFLTTISLAPVSPQAIDGGPVRLEVLDRAGTVLHSESAWIPVAPMADSAAPMVSFDLVNPLPVTSAQEVMVRLAPNPEGTFELYLQGYDPAWYDGELLLRQDAANWVPLPYCGECGLRFEVVIATSHGQEPSDADGDGVPDADDRCPGTDLGAGDLPSRELRTNRYHAAEDGSFVSGAGADSGLSVRGTAGCAAQQIVEVAGLGAGHVRFGISRSALEDFVDGVSA